MFLPFIASHSIGEKSPQLCLPIAPAAQGPVQGQVTLDIGQEQLTEHLPRFCKLEAMAIENHRKTIGNGGLMGFDGIYQDLVGG